MDGTPTKQLFDDQDELIESLWHGTPATAVRRDHRVSSGAKRRRDDDVFGSPTASTSRQWNQRKHADSEASPAPKLPPVQRYIDSVMLGGSKKGRSRTHDAPTTSVAAPRTAMRMPAARHAPKGELVHGLPSYVSVSSTPAPTSSGCETFDDTPLPLSNLSFATPIATQLFLPDEPLTATQEAIVPDNFPMPSPQPFFGSPREGGGDDDIAVKSTQVKAAEWADGMKQFFQFIDQRRIVDVDPFL